MTTPVHEPLTDREIDEYLDQLIPPTPSPGRRLLVSATIVGCAAVATVLAIGGYLYPRPTFGGVFESNGFLEADPSLDAVSATVMMPNFGQRTVRITEIDVDAPGADLVAVGVILEPNTSSSASNDSDSGQEAAGVEPFEARSEQVSPLPISVAPGQWARLVVWFRPTTCEDQPGPWGIVQPTVDFGAGAFPPFANTFDLDQDPIAIVDPDATEDNGGELVSLMSADGSFSTWSGPLAAACEALR